MGMDFDFSMLKPMDILDLAIYVEEEAQEHYEQLASWVQDPADDRVLSFLKRMAGLEALHRQQIMELREKKFGPTPPNYTSNVAWEVEMPDYDKFGESMTLVQAMEMALESEDRAYRYYNEAIGYFTDEESIQLLERLRNSEVDHKRMVQEEIDRLKN